MLSLGERWKTVRQRHWEQEALLLQEIVRHRQVMPPLGKWGMQSSRLREWIWEWYVALT
jgi:hypothetical protein